MRKILLSAICVLATLVSASKTSVSAKTGELYSYTSEDALMSMKYTYDFGYSGTNQYEVDEDSKIVSYNAALGLYSTFDFVLQMSLWDKVIRNFKFSITPFAFNPISVTANWAHPITVSQGEDMSATLDVGYDLNIGDMQLYYNFDQLLPSVSLLDYIRGTSDILTPSSLKKDPNPLIALFQKLYLQMHQAPAGWAWSQEFMPLSIWEMDPYVKFNLGDWLNENSETTITTSGSYIETIDFFSAYNEEQAL